MSLDAQQLLDRVTRPTLAYLGLPGGLAAERLVMGTAAKESGLVHLRQLGPGPARGPWQIEPATYADTVDRWLLAPSRAALRDRFLTLVADFPDPVEQLHGNLYLGCAVCRLIYYSRSFTLRGDEGVEELADIWKQYFNTPRGAGRPEEFVASFRRLLSSVY